MNSFNDWYLYGESLARSLVAVSPEYGSTMFTEVMNSIASSGQTAMEEGHWYRAFKGYIYYGGDGGDNHYQRAPPDGIAPDEIRDARLVQSDRLVREAEQFLSEVETAAAGQPVQMHQNDGQPLMFQASGDDLAQLQSLAEVLKNTLAACQQNYNQALMFDINIDLMQLFQSALKESGGSPKAIVDLVRAGAARVVDLRWRCAADARLTALFLVQTRLCELALQEFENNQISANEVVRLASMMIAGLRFAPNPENLMTKTVIDFSRAQLGNLVLNLCDETLSSAEHEVEEALNGTDLLTHTVSLFGCSSCLCQHASGRSVS